MAMVVVHRLEVVQVQKQQCQPPIGLRGGAMPPSAAARSTRG
jgi:hypothetical protein